MNGDAMTSIVIDADIVALRLSLHKSSRAIAAIQVTLVYLFLFLFVAN